MKPKKTDKLDKRLVRGFIGISRYWSEEMQSEMLRKAGVDPGLCYIQRWRNKNPQDTKERDEAIRALGPGRVLLVCGLGRLARGEEDLEEVISLLIASGGAIRDVETGDEFSGRAVAKAARHVVKAIAEYKRDGWKPGLEAAQAVPQQKKKRLAIAQARKPWRDPAIATIPEALKLMPGWDENAAYRYIGPRFPGRKLGRKVGSVDTKKRRKAKAKRKK